MLNLSNKEDNTALNAFHLQLGTPPKEVKSVVAQTYKKKKKTDETIFRENKSYPD